MPDDGLTGSREWNSNRRVDRWQVGTWKLL